jgi:hypothetical protein
MMQHEVKPGELRWDNRWPNSPQIKEALLRLKYIGFVIESRADYADLNYVLSMSVMLSDVDETHPIETGYLISRLLPEPQVSDFRNGRIQMDHSAFGTTIEVLPERASVVADTVVNFGSAWHPSWPEPTDFIRRVLGEIVSMGFSIDTGYSGGNYRVTSETPLGKSISTFENFIKLGFYLGLLSDSVFPEDFEREKNSDTIDVFAGNALLFCKDYNITVGTMMFFRATRLAPDAKINRGGPASGQRVYCS